MIDAKEVLQEVLEGRIDQALQVYYAEYESDLKGYFGDWWELNGTPKSNTWYLLAWSLDKEEPFSPNYDMVATAKEGEKCYIYELQ